MKKSTGMKCVSGLWIVLLILFTGQKFAGFCPQLIAAETDSTVNRIFEIGPKNLREASSRNRVQSSRLIAEAQRTDVPVPDPQGLLTKPVPLIPRPTKSSTADADANSKREEAILVDQIELQRLLKNLGPEHPKIRQIQDRIRLTQEWLAERQKDMKRSVIIHVPGRDPNDISKLLTQLFGDKINIAVDEATESVVIAISQAKSTTEAHAIVNEIESMAKRLEPLPVAAARPIIDKLATDEKDASMDRSARQLAARIRTTKPDELPALRKELETLTAKQFEYRQERRMQEFKALLQRAERLKSIHALREANKAEVIERRINELLDPKSELRWEETEPVCEQNADASPNKEPTPEALSVPDAKNPKN